MAIDPKLNKPLMRRKNGKAGKCLNQIAYERQAHIAVLSHPNFNSIQRSGVMRGKLTRRKGGVEHYVYP